MIVDIVLDMVLDIGYVWWWFVYAFFFYDSDDDDSRYWILYWILDIGYVWLRVLILDNDDRSYF